MICSSPNLLTQVFTVNNQSISMYIAQYHNSYICLRLTALLSRPSHRTRKNKETLQLRKCKNQEGVNKLPDAKKQQQQQHCARMST